MKTTVVFHSADMDGLFCREIARKFLPDAELIGWDFKDAPLPIPEGQIYILDLPVDRVFGFTFKQDENFQTVHSHIKGETPNTCESFDSALNRIIWIDHHRSSIESHPTDIPGYRIDGVSACRMAWQFFSGLPKCDTCGSDNGESMFAKHEGETCRQFGCFGTVHLPQKQDFVDRTVSEPLAVRLAGEYDVWDKRSMFVDPFQFGLDTFGDNVDWKKLLEGDEDYTIEVCKIGEAAQRCYAKRDADVIRERSFIVEWEGLKFLALTTARCNSLTFASKDVKETGHDALMGFYFDGTKWNFSLYHARHNMGIDLSKIAVKHGGGGHAGACGFQCQKPPFEI